MDFNKFLDDIFDEKNSLQSSLLSNLSHLSREELCIFKEKWARAPLERKREIIENLLEIADANVEFDFDPIFKICLDDEDGEVKKKAIRGLKDCDDLSFMRKLIKLLQDKDEGVREMAASALGDFTLRAELGKLSKEVSECLEKALLNVLEADDSLRVKRRAIESLGHFSRERVKEEIIKAYRSGDRELRIGAIYAMGKNCDPSWIPFLMESLESHDPEIRYEAARSCGEIGAKKMVPKLINLLKDPDDEVKLMTIITLGKIGGEEALRKLKECLEDEDELVREAAQEALSYISFWKDPLSFE